MRSRSKTPTKSMKMRGGDENSIISAKGKFLHVSHSAEELNYKLQLKDIKYDLIYFSARINVNKFSFLCEQNCWKEKLSRSHSFSFDFVEQKGKL